MFTRNLRRILLVAVVFTPQLVRASPVTVVSQDLPNQCDVLAPLPTISDELGTSAAFPLDERISATFTIINNDACLTSSSPAIPNVLLSITNLTGNISFRDLHYVADPGTGFTNFDGVINTFEAVRLDNVGVNRPLVSEIGGSLPLIFEPGETWEVILDDWGNGFGLTPADMGSIGVPSALIPPVSSGSIVAIPIPEPSTVLLAISTVGVGLAGRRRQSGL